MLAVLAHLDIPLGCGMGCAFLKFDERRDGMKKPEVIDGVYSDVTQAAPRREPIIASWANLLKFLAFVAFLALIRLAHSGLLPTQH